MAATILEFQQALLEDEELIEPVFAAVRAGQPADQAWGAALDREIAEYRAADDATFEARAADLVDLRDRVVRGADAGCRGACRRCCGRRRSMPTRS